MWNTHGFYSNAKFSILKTEDYTLQSKENGRFNKNKDYILKQKRDGLIAIAISTSSFLLYTPIRQSACSNFRHLFFYFVKVISVKEFSKCNSRSLTKTLYSYHL